MPTAGSKCRSIFLSKDRSLTSVDSTDRAGEFFPSLDVVSGVTVSDILISNTMSVAT